MKIITSLDSEFTESNVFKFKVYRSPKDGQTVLGYLLPFGAIHPSGDAVTWVSTPFGVPVKEALRDTIRLAERYGMSAVLIVDDDNLFPESERG